MRFAQRDHFSHIIEQIDVLALQRPIDFVNGIRRVIGVIVAALGLRANSSPPE